MKLLGSVIEELLDDVLRARIANILRAMERLSEGPVSQIGGISISHGKAGSREPRAGRSLADEYRERFQRAKSVAATRRVCREAEIALDRAVMGQRAKSRHRWGNEADDIREIIEHGVGIPAEEIAAELTVPPGWVAKVRREHRQRESDGQPKEGFLGWSDEQRYKEVQKLRNRGIGQPKAAVMLGVAKRTVQRYWHQAPERRAA